MNKKLIDLELINDARECFSRSNLIHKTPMLSNVESLFDLHNVELFLKLENMQNNGNMLAYKNILKFVLPKNTF